ncbi:hypothetical protein KVR01_008764 [Diaporthe batatas]|uniref:uncharacterized protein n=1 Tax=Diaporthe batatas TaxID=748121 RepID=UPI001D04ACF3|nr:uncharacterized protein KVR01_008764 [Diaporthe batatas]KAG8161777.1 hypothetical protein KVR01_008764 [Diaporthe batatas]
MPAPSRITKFCQLFLDGDDRYVFFTTLANGGTSQAQLVLHIPTSELRVRKVTHLPLDREATRKKNSEEVLFLLQEQAAKQGAQPHISHLYSSSDVPAVGSHENSELWSRVSYSKWYNGGTVGELIRAYTHMEQAIPSTTVWRLTTQVVDALHFMSTCGEGVLHLDLHSENIFLHYEGAEGSPPNFYIGDFGNAEHGPAGDRTRDVGYLSFQLNRWLFVSPAPEPSGRDELWKYLHFVVLPALRDIAASQESPDLEPVIELLRNAPAGPVESLPEWLDRRAEYSGLPMFKTYEDECVEEQGVNGPWYAAKVSIDTDKRHFKVLSISEDAHCSAVPQGHCDDSLRTPNSAKRGRCIRSDSSAFKAAVARLVLTEARYKEQFPEQAYTV